MQQRKELGFWVCTALVIGNTIGIGIFVLPASLAPYGFNAMIGWAITVVGMTFLARVFAQLAREFPTADGPHVYIERTTGSLAAFVAIWCYWVSCWITNAAIAIGVVGYLTKVVPALGQVSPALLAVTMLWLFVGINLLGMRAGGRVQIVTTVLKLLPMLFVIGLGAWLLGSDPAVYSRQLPTTPITLGDVMAASTIALFAMLGIESAAVPAGRVRDPERTIPKSTMFGTLLTAAIYIAMSSIALLLIPADVLGQSSAPFSDLLDRHLGSGNSQWLSLFVVISGLGALNGWTLLVSELTASLGRHGFLPPVTERLNSRGAPVVGLLVTGLLATAMVLMNYSKSLVEGFTFLTQVVTAANLPLYLLCAVALVVLSRRGERNVASSVLVLGVIGTAYSVFAFIGLGHEPFLWSIALAAAGLPLFAWLRRRRSAVALPLLAAMMVLPLLTPPTASAQSVPAASERSAAPAAVTSDGEAATTAGATPTAAAGAPYTADGRLALDAILPRFATLSTQHGWTEEWIHRYPAESGLSIKAWRTPRAGPALWVVSGIHGEEPAGPNAIAANLQSLVDVAKSGIPVVVLPLCNPRAYRHNWRYPNTPERDWRKGGYSVGDAEYLLPNLEDGRSPRDDGASGPETLALTQFVLRLAQRYPPRLVLDLHEDELSKEGGYIYSQGIRADDNPVGAEIIRLLRETGIPVRHSGRTRFGETIVDGVISRDDQGRPIRDGSIDELFAATEIFEAGRKVPGPAAHTVIVVETPAFEGSRFDLRVAAQGAVVRSLARLWQLNETVTAPRGAQEH